VAKRISGRTFVVGAAVAAVGLLAESALTWVRKETPPAWAPATAALATVVIAGLNAVLEKGREETVPVYRPAYPGYAPRPAPRPAARGGFGIATVLVVVLLVCGVGGWVGATFLPKAVMVVRDQTGPPWERKLGHATERLAAPATYRGNGLTIEVTGVAVYKSETVVSLTVTNANPDAAHVGVYRSVQLDVPDAATLDPDVPRSDSTWGEDVGGHSHRTGSIAFAGAVPAGATSATLTFINVIIGFDHPTINVPLSLKP
jgi:hypothetical protein